MDEPDDSLTRVPLHSLIVIESGFKVKAIRGDEM